MLGVCTATALASRPSPPGPPSCASIVKMQLGDLARRPGPPAQAVVVAGRIWSSRTSVPQPNPDRVRKSAEHCGLRTLTRSMPSCVTQIVIAVLVLYLAPAPVLPGIAPDFFLALSLLAWKLQHFPWEFLEGRVAWMRLRRYRPPRPVERALPALCGPRALSAACGQAQRPEQTACSPSTLRATPMDTPTESTTQDGRRWALPCCIGLHSGSTGCGCASRR